MPTVAGRRIGTTSQTDMSQAPFYVGQGHPVNWLDYGQNEQLGLQPVATMQGHPPPFAAWQAKQIAGPGTTIQGFPVYLHSRPYSRGAPAYAPKFGVLNWNPIGAGIYAPYKLPVIAGPGARYVFGAIWFDVQAISTSLQLNPTVPVETVNALIATSSVGGSYLTTG